MCACPCHGPAAAGTVNALAVADELRRLQRPAILGELLDRFDPTGQDEHRRDAVYNATGLAALTGLVEVDYFTATGGPCTDEAGNAVVEDHDVIRLAPQDRDR